jgi:hypothetical protein
VGESETLEVQMVLLTLQSLANSSPLKSLEDDDEHSDAHSGVSVLSRVNTAPGKSGFATVLREHDTSDSIQWLQAQIVHNQDRDHLDQSFQHRDTLYVVVAGMIQVYTQVLLSRHIDDTTGPVLPQPE